MKHTLDAQILNLFIERSEGAIARAQMAYNAYMSTIAYNILANNEDVKECINDTLLKVWNTIPPNKPNSLKAYIGTIIRNVALDRYRKEHSKKRSLDNGFCQVLDELNECIPNVNDTYKIFESSQISAIISDYLASISAEKRYIFVSRYYYAQPIKTISKDLHLSQANIKTILFRTRKELKEKLEAEGVYI